MKKILWCLLISFILLGINPLAFAGLSEGEWTIEVDNVYKTWQPNGDCDISVSAGVHEERRQREARWNSFPVLKVSWSKGGVWEYRMVDIRDSVRIPRAYEVKDWEVNIQTGWATESRARDGVFSNESDGGTLNLDIGIRIAAYNGSTCGKKHQGMYKGNCVCTTKFNNCTIKDIAQFFDNGETQAKLWNWSKNNPPKITLNSSKVSGEWAAGTFTQTFEFSYEAKTNPDNSKARTFEIELIYGNSICLESEQFHLEIGTKTMRIVNTGMPQTITLSVPQNEVSRFSHMQKGPSPILINAFRWKVTELIDGRDPIVRTFFIPVSSTLTIN